MQLGKPYKKSRAKKQTKIFTKNLWQKSVFYGHLSMNNENNLQGPSHEHQTIWR